MPTARRKFCTPPFVMENVDRLTVLREQKGLSRRELAEKSGIPVQYIGQYERGYVYPTQDNYNKLTKFFHWEVWKR